MKRVAARCKDEDAAGGAARDAAGARDEGVSAAREDAAGARAGGGTAGTGGERCSSGAQKPTPLHTIRVEARCGLITSYSNLYNGKFLAGNSTTPGCPNHPATSNLNQLSGSEKRSGILGFGVGLAVRWGTCSVVFDGATLLSHNSHIPVNGPPLSFYRASLSLTTGIPITDICRRVSSVPFCSALTPRQSRLEPRFLFLPKPPPHAPVIPPPASAAAAFFGFLIRPPSLSPKGSPTLSRHSPHSCTVSTHLLDPHCPCLASSRCCALRPHQDDINWIQDLPLTQAIPPPSRLFLASRQSTKLLRLLLSPYLAM
ncbi:hypothetical protein B0H16DRAFT_1467787 [Mycena metata]|uniref:Uncharacterized protein n=1 Tax=Mycena metata TaxID=1033252 RepID=A0AAD7MVD6_9AGAR|nr:hypothetical protein B0H16DRAFT_1467787 [Mycena metata]